MNRLTEHSRFFINSVVPSKNLGDLCTRMKFCDEFDFCDGCPVKRIMDRLCEYEDTDLEPKEIVEMKKAANIKRCQRKGIVGAPKSGAKILFQEVSEYGIIIGGVIYGIPTLINEHRYEKVKIRIVNNIATVFDIETDEQIVWFELYPHKGINCKHKFSPYFTEENMRKYGYTREDVAKAITQIKE